MLPCMGDSLNVRPGSGQILWIRWEFGQVDGMVIQGTRQTFFRWLENHEAVQYY